MSAGTLYIAVKGDTKELVTALKSAQSMSVKFGKDSKRDFDLVGKGVDALKRQVIALGAAWVGTQGIGAVIKIADQYSLLDSKIKLVTKGSEEFGSVYGELFSISQKTGSSFADNASNYANLALALKDTNITSTQTLGIFEDVNKSLVVAGATTAEASSFMLQFRQAMGSGKLAGDEFRGMMESNSYWGGLLAKALDTDVAGLREMAKEGKLTTSTLMKAFPEMSAQIDKDFSGITKTIARAMVELSNAFNDVIADANKTTGGTTNVATAVSDLATTITQNKEAISSLFVGIIKGAGAAVETIVNVANSVRALRLIIHSESGSISDWIFGDADDMKKVISEFGNGTTQAKDLLAQIRQEIKDTQNQWGNWSDKADKLKGLREEEAALVQWLEKGNDVIVKTNNLLEDLHDKRESSLRDTSEKEVDILKDEYSEIDKELNKFFAKNDKIEKSLTRTKTKELKQRTKEAKDYLDNEVRLSKAAAKDITDSWQKSYELQEDALADFEKAENEALRDREKLAEDVTKDIKRLTMSELDFKLDALEEEYRERVELAGKDKKLQDDLTEWKKRKIDEIETETGHSLMGMLKDWESFTDGVGDDFGNFAENLITGEFKTVGDAWEGLWKSMLATAAQYLGNIVAQFAATKIADVVSMFFHTGAWELKDDEYNAVLQSGEMVIPKEQADEIRKSFPNGGSFKDLAAAVDPSIGFGPQGLASFANIGVTTGVRALLGLGVNPARSVAQYGNQATMGLISSELSRVTKTNPGVFGTDAYSSLGSFLGSGAAAGWGGMAGAEFNDIAGFFGGLLGGVIGDAVGDRSYEGLRDALEDGVITNAEAVRFKAEADRMGVSNSGYLGGFFDAIQSAVDGITGAFGMSAFGGGSGGNGFGDTGDGMGDLGRTDASRDSEGSFAHTGGFLLKSDEGRIIAQTGEGVLSRVGMKNLDKLNTGDIGGDEIKSILLAIATSVKSSAKMLQRAVYDGIPTVSREHVGTQLVYAASIPSGGTAALKEDGSEWLKEDGTAFYKE